MPAPRLLEGLKILVVEDNLLLAGVGKILLEDSGCQVVGRQDGLQRGLDLTHDEPLDEAILDFNLHGGMSFGCFVRAACHLSSSPDTKTAASSR